MTKMKKISKIIPAVLLSGAMVVPVSQLTSPVVAHAYENSAYTQKAVDYTPTITRLVDADLSSPQSRSVQRNYSNDVVVPTNGEIVVNLEGKDYHEFKAKLAVPKDDNNSIRYRVYLDDDRQIKDTVINPGEEKDLHVDLFGDDAKKLKIVATSTSNSRANNPGLIESGTFTTYYTDYTDILNIDERLGWTRYQRASRDYVYIGTQAPLCPQYLRTNIRVEFPTVSNDPCLTGSKSISSELKKVDNGFTVLTRTGIEKEGYCGNRCCSVTLGVKVQYKLQNVTRARQYYDARGNIIRSHAVNFKTYIPVAGSDQYASIRTKDLPQNNYL